MTTPAMQSEAIGAPPTPTAAGAAGRAGVPGVLLFFAATHGAMLLFGGLAVLVAQGRVALPVPPLALVAVGGIWPILAAIGAAAYEAGGQGVRALLAQVARWRFHLRWYAVALLGPVLVMVAAFVLDLVLGSPRPPAPPAAVWQSLPILGAVYLVLALLEEVGWRGYAQPRLQRSISALGASLVIGALWAVWHLPQWWIPETGQAAKWPFWVFAAGTIAQAVGLGWLYNRAGGAVLLAILAHAAINLAPEPWAAAWLQLPEGARGPYPAVLIAAVWVAVALVISLTELRGLTRRSGGTAG